MVTLIPLLSQPVAARLNWNFDPNAVEVNGKADIDFSELQLSSKSWQEAKFKSSFSHGSPRWLTMRNENNS